MDPHAGSDPPSGMDWLPAALLATLTLAAAASLGVLGAGIALATYRIRRAGRGDDRDYGL